VFSPYSFAGRKFFGNKTGLNIEKDNDMLGASMKYEPEIHHRKSIRLRGYDYSQAGAYFVTISTKSKEYLFGDVVEEGMRLNEVGQMVQMVWDELPKYYQGVAINAFQIMPNNVHGIIILKHPISPVGANPLWLPC